MILLVCKKSAIGRHFCNYVRKQQKTIDVRW
jgi:hypothetical protein